MEKCNRVKVVFESCSVFRTCLLIILIMDSSSASDNENDDCITGFTGGEPFVIVDDDAPLLKRFKSDHYEGLSLSTILGDGCCIANCFAVHFSKLLDRVLNHLDTKFRAHILFYKDFSELSEDEIKLQVFKYITKKTYTNSIADMFLNTFSGIYKTKVIKCYTKTNNADKGNGDNFKEKTLLNLTKQIQNHQTQEPTGNKILLLQSIWKHLKTM